MKKIDERIEDATFQLGCKEVETLLKIRTNDGMIYTYKREIHYRDESKDGIAYDSQQEDRQYVDRVRTKCIEDLLHFNKLMERGTPILFLEEMVLISPCDIGRAWIELGAIFVNEQPRPQIDDNYDKIEMV